MDLYNIGDVVYIVYNGYIHSCLIVGIKVPYTKGMSVTSIKSLYNEKLVEYKLVTISTHTQDASMSAIAQPDGLYHFYDVETKYGEHIRNHNEIFTTIDDAKNNIKLLENIV